MTTPSPSNIVQTRFKDAFAGTPRLFRAPGRINIIGEHVDYAGGKVMPAAIDFACWVAARPNGQNRLRVISDLGDGELPLDMFERHGDWRDYVAGMAFALRDAGHPVVGHDLAIASDVPMGAGVSSSAALEVAVGLALTGGAVTGKQLAVVAQAAENHYVGMACGIMDQFASACGVEGHALVLDCSSLHARPIAMPDTACFLIVDSGVKHRHTSGGYASRRADCETAAKALGVSLLAEIASVDALAGLSGNPLKRARHVVSEIARTSAAEQALATSDLAHLGQLLNQSHASLSSDMEVSTPEVDRLTAIAQATPGVYGARMMGGGFGGSIIALAAPSAAEAALDAILTTYAQDLGHRPGAFVVRAAAGAGEVL
ncbi:galactokinase [Candidatus Phycosocius bacilliformis]|nr:galactokinase [Candidatus Phycosocius bacilliformis]